MKKQYRITEEHMFKKTIEIYQDGQLISSERMWIDEADKYIDCLERDGFVYGYTQHEIDDAKRIYEDMFANLIGGNDNDKSREM